MTRRIGGRGSGGGRTAGDRWLQLHTGRWRWISTPIHGLHGGGCHRVAGGRVGAELLVALAGHDHGGYV